MDISKWLVVYYLRQITVTWFARENLPPPDVGGYAVLLENLVEQAEANGESEPLRRGIALILARPDIPASPLASTLYPYSEEQAREILRLIMDGLPVTPAGDPGADALVETPLAQWRAAHGTAGASPAGG